MDKYPYKEAFLKELNAEVPATRKCLERIPENLFAWKPHERSMTFGYLSLLVAEIPKWISVSIEQNEIDFATFKHFQPATTQELINHFDENIQAARNSLENITGEILSKDFVL
jgi:hypothetical protein